MKVGFDKFGEEIRVLDRDNANSSEKVSESDETRVSEVNGDGKSEEADVLVGKVVSDDRRAEEVRVLDVDSDDRRAEVLRVLDVDSDDRRAEEVRVLDVDLKSADENIENSDQLSDKNDGTERLVSGAGSGRGTESTSRGDLKIRARARKGQVQVVKFSVSQYESILDEFDQFAANGRGLKETAPVVERQPGYGYEIGDMVWGKVKSHPWWPGQIYTEAFVSPSVRGSKREGHVLVAFFGDSSYGWFDPAELIPFDLSFSEKSQQTSSRNFLKAVEEAVDEATRRSALALTCRCRNPYNFRPTNVQGYFAVDVCDYEPGTIYSVDQIKKARDSLKPREMLAFVNRIAKSPTGNDHGAIEFRKNNATVLAYRKAVYEEFDETYAQAFGHQPVRASREQTLEMGQPLKVPTRAPLSGPLVIAEVLGKGKGSAKPNKGKIQAKKDQYLFKRRHEPGESKISVQNNPSTVTASADLVYVEGPSASAKDDNVLQKESSLVSTGNNVEMKDHLTEIVTGNSFFDGSRKVPTTEVMAMEKPTVITLGTAGTQSEMSKAESPSSSPVDPGPFDHPLEASSFPDKMKHEGMTSEESFESNVAVGLHTQNDSGIVGERPCASEISVAEIIFRNDYPSSTDSEALGLSLSPPAKAELHDGFTAAHLSGITDASFDGKGTKVETDIDKKVKVRKRAVGELNSEKSIPLGKNKKQRKGLMGSQSMQMHLSGRKDRSSVDNIAGKFVSAPVASGDSQLNPQKKEDKVSSSVSPDSVVTHKIAKIDNVNLQLPQLLHNLQALALNPFYHLESSPATVRQIFLKFRSLVFQKSLASLPTADSGSKESKSAAAVAANNVSTERVRELQSVKPQKPMVKPDDPAKGGRKRGPSDRQEDIAVKKKKIIDARMLTAEKNIKKSVLMQRAEAKETNTTTKRLVKPEPVKKVEPPSRVSDPTMLVLKFPPEGTLPSMNELKARFIRFGQLDHSACRVFWKSSTCRVVFRHKVDAQAAYKFAAATSNMFGSTGVRYYLREMEVAAPEQQESGKVQREEMSTSTSQLRDTAAQRRLAVPQTLQQSGVQLKSILKRSTGDETSGNGGIKGGTPRVKFMLGGEETSKGAEQYNNASFSDAGASSTSHGMDFNSKSFQNIIPPSTLPPLLPTPVNAAYQFPTPPQNNLQYTEVAPSNTQKFNIPTDNPMNPSTPYIDISHQMLSLLTQCSDIVTNVAAYLGYLPYHPL